MKRLEEFRIFYNTTIHPELMRLEQRRLRLLRLLLLSGLLLGGVLAFQFYLNVLALTLVLSIPITLYLGYLLYRVREFVLRFKPQVVGLILDFIDDGLNRGALVYSSERSIDKARFLASRLFATSAPYYQGEDFIAGKVGEMPFELCELDVREPSPVRARLDTVFKGVFLYAIFPEETEGEIVVWPRHSRQFHTRAIRAFTWNGSVNVDHEVLNDDFRRLFMTYATPDTHVVSILSEPMQDAIVRYVEETRKELFISFLDKEIYVAVSEPKDMLEPYIFRSNLSFELVREFFEDINLLLQIVEDFDQTH
jgi:hypothetical protein